MTKKQLRRLIREALDQDKLQEHLLEDITEAFAGILKDLDTIKTFAGVDQAKIKHLQRLVKDVNLKLEKW